MLPKSLAVSILVLVSLVWSVDFGAQFVTSHQPSPAIQGTFLALVGGALIRAGWVARRQLDEANAPPPPPVPEPRPAEAPPAAAPPAAAPPPTQAQPHDPYDSWDGEGRHRGNLRLLRGIA